MSSVTHSGAMIVWVEPGRPRLSSSSSILSLTFAPRPLCLATTGQKFPTPTPGFGDRVFYETLLRQRPDSLMAQEWYVGSWTAGRQASSS